MRALVIGTGAGGNKAVIDLIKKGIIPKEDAVLVNSTLKDIPQDYKNSCVILSNSQEGCGKERSVAKDITLEALQSGKLNLKAMVNPEHKKAIIVTTLEGGTGSGSSVIIASYLTNVVGINTEIIGFSGFEEDGRGLQNTIEFFQDLDDSYSIQLIRNSAFIKEANGNKLKAEQLANDELVKRLNVSLGNVIKDSVQNIDETDIYKLVNTVGYTTIEYKEIDEKIKSKDQFNAIISEMLNNSKSMDMENPAMVRLGVIVNLPESGAENIDYEYTQIKEKLGYPYEVFSHIEDCEDIPRFVAFIASGMRMPKEEVMAIYDRYKKESERVNKSKDDFFNSIRGMQGNAEDNKFNMVKSVSSLKDTSAAAENAFFSKFAKNANPVKNEVKNNNSNNQKNRSEY